MPDAETIRDTVDRYTKLFSAGDRDGWLALWHEDATMEDPVGSDVRHGRDAIAAFWDAGAGAAGARLELTGPVRVPTANDAAFPMEVKVSLGDEEIVLPAIDVMTFDDDGLITSQRAFFDT